MNRLTLSICCLSACLLFVVAGLVFAQDDAVDQKAVEAISHPPELQLSLWADSSQLSNPVAFTFDDHGRMFLCETFRQNKGVEDNRGHMTWLDDDLAAQSVEDRLVYFKKHLGEKLSEYEQEEDRITVIVDEDGDGRADKDWVFADGFTSALTGTGAGVLTVGDDVYFTCIPKLWKLTDNDSDGMADSREALHHGYGVRVAFRGHDLHGLVMGPDGRVYFSIGDRGYNIQTSEGNHLKDPESGAVFRCDLDGSNLEVFATGLRNPQELAFDDFGNLFTGDNNSDSGDEARWVHVIEGGDTGWRMAFQYLPDRGPWNREKLWHPRHAGQPAFIVPPIRNFADGPSGLTCYPGTGLGDAYLGTFFLCDFRGDAAISGIRSFKMKPKGASFEMSEDRQFLWNVLATDIEFGPDGGLYLTDWIEGWEGVNRGRVVRVTHPDEIQSQRTQDVRATLAKDLSKEKVGRVRKLLSSPDRRVRMKAQFELAKREAAFALEKEATEGTDPKAKLHATWGLGQVARTTQDPKKKRRSNNALKRLLKSEDPYIRAAAATTLGDLRLAAATNGIVAALVDSDMHVRSAAAIAIGKLGQSAGKTSAQSSAFGALITMIAENNDVDAVLRHAGAMGLFGVASPETLSELATHTSPAVRMASVLALRRYRSPLVSRYLDDDDERIVVETARAIHDAPIYEAMPNLANAINDTSNDEALIRRTLNANYRLGDLQNAQAIANYLVSAAATEAMQLEAIEMLANWEAPSNRDRVLGMWRPIDERSAEPAKVAMQAILPKLTELPPAAAVRVAQVAASMGIPGAEPIIGQMVTSAKYQPSHRADLLRSMVELNYDGVQQVVLKSLDDSAPIIRSTARKSLVKLDRKKGIDELLKAMTADTTIERQAAFAGLSELVDSSIKKQVRSLIRTELMNGKFPADSHLDLVEAAKSHGLESELAPFLATFKDLPYAEHRLSLEGGNVDRGEKLFHENLSLSCLRCHRVGETGGRVGPNLAGIGKEKTPEYLLESIVDPNKKVADGFGTLIVVTEDGVQLQGIVRKEAEDLIHMIDADGKRFHVVKEEIEFRKNGKSAMPEDLLKHLNAFQLRDLVAYLGSLKTPWVDETIKHEE